MIWFRQKDRIHLLLMMIQSSLWELWNRLGGGGEEEEDDEEEEEDEEEE